MINLFLLQVENLLLSSSGAIKLCDFGSATTKTHFPDSGWSAIQRSLVEDEVRLCLGYSTLLVR